jgi:hypothetical protein
MVDQAFYPSEDCKACAAEIVETTQEEELARIYHVPIPKQTDLPIFKTPDPLPSGR